METDEDLSIDRKLDIPEEEPKKQIPLEKIVRRRSDHALARARIDEADAALNLEKSNRFSRCESKLFRGKGTFLLLFRGTRPQYLGRPRVFHSDSLPTT